MFALAIEAGLREDEKINKKNKDKDVKTDSSVRLAPIPSELMSEFEIYKGKQTEDFGTE